MSTRDAIISCLRKEPMTASELAERLAVTRNAVVVPLRQLEAEGLVIGEERKTGRVGKPAVQYSVSLGREDLASKAYPPFVEALLETASETVSRKDMERLMIATGRRLAGKIEIDPGWTADKRLEVATAFLDRLGAETMLEAGEGCAVLRSHSCPLARAVRKENCVCSVVQSFLESVTGAEVTEACSREERLRCKFRIAATGKK